jgi:hypothetical protein
MALLAAERQLPYIVDAAIFADTQAEPEGVYKWLDWLEQQLPFPVYRKTKGSLADDSLILKRSGKSGKIYQKTYVPFFCKKDDGGSRGMMMRKCTADYKVRVIIKTLRWIVGKPALNKWRRERERRPLVNTLIGISTDEAHRMKPSQEEWIENKWPLIEMGMTRQDCLSWMEKQGYPRPPRSACVFCPYHSDAEWARLKKEEPEDFRRAVEWEKKVQEVSKSDETQHSSLFLHQSLVPLDQVDFDLKEEEGHFGNECEGMCGL